MNDTANLLKYFNQQFEPLNLKASCKIDKLVLEDSLGIVYESTSTNEFFDYLGEIRDMYIG